MTATRLTCTEIKEIIKVRKQNDTSTAEDFREYRRNLAALTGDRSLEVQEPIREDLSELSRRVLFLMSPVAPTQSSTPLPIDITPTSLLKQEH